MGIYIRPITKEDTELIVSWRNNERVRTNFVFQERFTNEMHNNWMDTKIASGEAIQFIVMTDDTQKPIGSVYLRDVTPETAEYGIFFGDDSEVGKGYGKMAVKLIMDYAFKELNLKYVICRIFADNMPSLKSSHASGFVEYERRMESIDGKDRELVFLKLEKERYEM